MPVYLSVFALAQCVGVQLLRSDLVLNAPQRIPVCHGHRCRLRPQHPTVHLLNVGLPANGSPALGKTTNDSYQHLCRLFNGLLIIYAAIQIGEIRAAIGDTDITVISKIPIDVLTTTIPIVISVSEVFFIGLGWKIYHEFGWKVYKFLGADRNIKRMYASYQIYECLVKFDVFFWAGFSVQFIWLVLQDSDWEYYVTCAALPLSIVLLVEGHLAARHENRWMMATFMSGCVGALIYFIYKVCFTSRQSCLVFADEFSLVAHQGANEHKHGHIQADMEIAYGVL
jgi:hypothetical protein